MLFNKRPEAYLNLGLQTAALGEMEESIQAWRDAIAVIESPDADPGDEETRLAWDTEFWPMAHTNLGQVLVMTGRPEDAIPVYETLLERDPDDVQARSALATALASTGQGDDALSIFEEILASEDGGPLDYFNAGVSLYQAEEMEKAVIGVREGARTSPHVQGCASKLGPKPQSDGGLRGQVPYSERLLELDPYNEFGYQMHVRAAGSGRASSGWRRPTRYHAGVTLRDRQSPTPADERRCQRFGHAINKTLEPGTTITLRFTFYDNDRNPLGTEDVEVTISDPDVPHRFQLTFDAETQLIGYSYDS